MPQLKYISPLILFFLFNNLYGQQIKRFYDHKHFEVPRAKANFYSVLDYKDSLWIENSYYLFTMKFYMYGRYKDSSCNVPVDTFYYFHDNGFLEQIGNYVNGKKDGLWRSYHSNRMLKDSINYVAGRPVGISFSWHDNGYLADSTYWTTDSGGNSISWNNEGVLDAIGHYNADHTKQGEWRFYHKNGKLSSFEVYESDSLKSIQSFDESGKLIPDDGVHTKVEIESEYPGGSMAWMHFLNRTLRYPDAAIQKNIQGTVVVQFIVDTVGKVSDIKAVSGNSVLAEEAIRVIKQSGKWVPAVSHGRKVKSFKKQPMVFRMEEMFLPDPGGIPQFRPVGG